MDLYAMRRKAMECAVRDIERSTKALCRALAAYEPLTPAAREVSRAAEELDRLLNPSTSLTENQRKVAEANRMIAQAAVTLTRSTT